MDDHDEEKRTEQKLIVRSGKSGARPERTISSLGKKSSLAGGSVRQSSLFC